MQSNIYVVTTLELCSVYNYVYVYIYICISMYILHMYRIYRYSTSKNFLDALEVTRAEFPEMLR